MDEYERDLLDCFRRSTCETFSHEQHLHVAWLLLQEHSLTAAIEKFADGARSLAASRGHPEFYHETITWAFMILVNERISDHREADWELFRTQNADLFAPDKQVLKQYYRPSTLDSDRARRVFVFPDAIASER